MTGVIVIDAALRQRVAEEISGMARSHPRTSLAADVLPQNYPEVVQGVAELIDLEATGDFEAAVIIGLARWKARHPEHFIRRRAHPNPPFSWKHSQ